MRRWWEILSKAEVWCSRSAGLKPGLGDTTMLDEQNRTSFRPVEVGQNVLNVGAKVGKTHETVGAIEVSQNVPDPPSEQLKSVKMPKTVGVVGPSIRPSFRAVVTGGTSSWL